MFSIGKIRKRIAPLPWPPFLFVLALATPPEASILLGSLRLSAYRVVLIAMLFPCLMRLLRETNGRLRWNDGLVLFHGCWATVALIKYAGVGQGIESGGIYFIEAVGAYLIGRCFVRNVDQFRALAAVMVLVVTVMLGFAAMEAVTGQHLIREVSRSAFGGPSLKPIEPRLGLHRAYASFDHPILFGIFCAAVFAPSVYVLGDRRDGPRRYLGAAATGAGTFLSLSAGAFSALGAQIAIVGWDWITRGIARRWQVLGGIIASIWIVVSLVSSRSPVKVFLTYLTFSPGTGYNRLRIWEYGSAEVRRHPVFGIGLGEWERPDWMISNSMDNFWLATAVRYGLPAFVSLAGALAVLCVRCARMRKPTSEERACRSAWMTALAGLAIAGSTVHYWNALFGLFCFLLGTSAWMTEPNRVRNVAVSRDAMSRFETGVAA